MGRPDDRSHLPLSGRSWLRRLQGQQAPWCNPAKETRRLLKILRLVLPILLAACVFRQVRKPSGWLGRRIARAMNLSHVTMADLRLQQVRVPRNAAILDVALKRQNICAGAIP